MRMLSLFSGVGMIDLATSWAGIETVAMCEIEPYPQKILKKRFPEVNVYDDIFKLSAERMRNDGIGKIDIIAGGFPCQPFSVAGNQKGEEDKRHLWPEMCRVIREFNPRWVLGENVPGLLSITDVSGRKGGTFGNILRDLAEMGYDAIWSVYGANEVGAPHKRERVFILGYSKHDGHATAEVEGIFRETISNNQKRQNQTSEFERASISSELSELWPTPTVNGNYNRKGLSATSGDGLATAVSMWPTPKATLRGDCPSERKRNTPDLASTVKRWPTPTASIYKGSCSKVIRKNGSDRRNDKLDYAIEQRTDINKPGQLNPDWVETLMGLPVGWTDIDCDNPKPFPGWPAAMGQEQYDYEPPRVATDIPNRANRLKAIGNGCVPEQIYPIFAAIAEIERMLESEVIA